MIISPLEGEHRVTQSYGERPEYYARFGLRGHNGIDYSCVVGTPVRAVADGVVKMVDSDPTGYGDYIRVWHKELRFHSLVGHLSAQLVKIGDEVKQGQEIARTGNSGNSTGPHLHYEIRACDENGNYSEVLGMKNGAIDPFSFLLGLDRGGTPFLPPRYEATPAFLRALEFVLAHEGGWSDNPQDSGGATMKGVTLGAYTAWRKTQGLPEPTKEQLRAISDDEVQQVYLAGYWFPSGAADLAWPLQLAHFDSAVLTGVGQAAKFLAASGGEFHEYVGERVLWFTKTAQWEVFGRGWMNRIGDLLKAAA